ncbi:aldolase/citrate lyase family protein [Streptomyces sp. NPDC050636]|uniref:aldolase/citrate lyase family protein n=1 Tax=Streptomyces sp. NPDC050636 TaxID=3154510 RepID=UPI00343274A4
MTAVVHRSYLYAPAHKQRLVEKAYASEADAVVLDLEDAVPLGSKNEARAAAAGILASTPPKPTYVRVNAPTSGLCQDDIQAVAGPGLAAVRLPKVDRPEHIRDAAAWLAEAGSQAGVQILVESALGVEALSQLATASPPQLGTEQAEGLRQAIRGLGSGRTVGEVLREAAVPE